MTRMAQKASSGGVISKQQVIDRWSILVTGGAGRADDVFEQTQAAILESGAPALTMARKMMMSNLITGLFGKKREFLVVKSDDKKLKPYQIFICARDYGKNLDVSWYLTCRLHFMASILNVAPLKLDLFDLQDLTAYATVCHHSCLEAVEKQMKSLKQDTSRIDRKTKGFLGIS